MVRDIKAKNKYGEIFFIKILISIFLSFFSKNKNIKYEINIQIKKIIILSNTRKDRSRYFQ